jgi:hypothetical protein
MSIINSIKTNHFEMMETRKWEFTYWGFDIHSTIVKPNYELGNIPTEFYPFALETLKIISERPDIKMMIYTCSHPHEQQEYLEFFKSKGILFNFLNRNPEVVAKDGGYGYYEDKPYFNVLFEDKAGFDAQTEWESLYYYLTDKYSDSKVNTRNEKLFEKYGLDHINHHGKVPMETALTDLVADCIKRKDYKIYNGGGSDINGESINKYDVVLYLDIKNDPYFMVSLNDDGDCCELYRCNDKCEIVKLII